MEEFNFTKFKEEGYLIYNPKNNNELLFKAQKSFEKILKNCQNQKYNYVRVYDDYSHNINIAGIEMIFDKDIIDQNIINLVQESKIINFAKKIFNNDEFVMTLSRYHVTKNFTHLGIWHRDGEPNTLNAFQSNIYLYDETGMEIVPQSHVRNNNESEEKVLRKFPYKDLRLQTPVTVKAGNVCVFNPSLIHRGKTFSDRAHLHFRFTKKNYLNKKFFLINKDYLKNFKINEEWLKVLDHSLNYENRESNNEYIFKNDFKSKLFRVIRYIIHNCLFFLPVQNKLNGIFKVRPCLNKKYIFKR